MEGNTAVLNNCAFLYRYIIFQLVASALGHLPDKRKFDEHTWEWTIGRDFADRVLGILRTFVLQSLTVWFITTFILNLDVAAYLLEQAIPLTTTQSETLMDAIYWLEVSVALEKSFPSKPGGPLIPPTSLLKNAGLGHAHLVQSKTVHEGATVGEFELPMSYKLFSELLQEPIDWPVDRK